MTFKINHAKVSSKLDGADSNLIQPSDWNANLVSTMTTGKLLGRYSANTGPIEEITVGSGLSLDSGTLSVSSGSGWTPDLSLGIGNGITDATDTSVLSAHINETSGYMAVLDDGTNKYLHVLISPANDQKYGWLDAYGSTNLGTVTTTSDLTSRGTYDTEPTGTIVKVLAGIGGAPTFYALLVSDTGSGATWSAGTLESAIQTVNLWNLPYNSAPSVIFIKDKFQGVTAGYFYYVGKLDTWLSINMYDWPTGSDKYEDSFEVFFANTSTPIIYNPNVKMTIVISDGLSTAGKKHIEEASFVPANITSHVFKIYRQTEVDTLHLELGAVYYDIHNGSGLVNTIEYSLPEYSITYTDSKLVTVSGNYIEDMIYQGYHNQLVYPDDGDYVYVTQPIIELYPNFSGAPIGIELRWGFYEQFTTSIFRWDNTASTPINITNLSKFNYKGVQPTAITFNTNHDNMLVAGDGNGKWTILSFTSGVVTVADEQPVIVTTGASDTTLPVAHLIHIISGGTASNERIVLPDLDEWTVGYTMAVYLKTKTNASDLVYNTQVDIANDVNFVLSTESSFWLLEWSPSDYQWIVKDSYAAASDTIPDVLLTRDNLGHTKWNEPRHIFIANQGYQNVDTGASLSTKFHRLNLTTIGASGTKSITIPSGSVTGERALYYLYSKGNVGDSISFTVTNMLNTAGTQPTSVILDTTGEQVMVEWQINKWKVICASSGVVT